MTKITKLRTPMEMVFKAFPKGKSLLLTLYVKDHT